MDNTGKTPDQPVSRLVQFRDLSTRVYGAICGPEAGRVAALTALRVFSAIGSLISVTVIVRVFPVDEAGKFFVFLAAAQFVAGTALGPLLMLAIRFGSVHQAADDREALGRLFLFGAATIALLVGILLLVLPLTSRIFDFAPSESWVFVAVAGLSGAMMFLGGLVRVNGKVIAAIVPENVMRPAGLAFAATALWLVGTTTFPALSAAYGVVLLAVSIVLAVMTPWRAARFTSSRFEAYRPYFKAYAPLLAFGLVSTALTTLDILLVSHTVAVEAVPAYKAAIQYAMLLGTGVIFANLIYGPQIAVAHQRGDLPTLQILAKASSRLALGFYALALAPLLVGPRLFELAFGAIGAEAWGLALILCAGRFANAWFGSVTNVAILAGRTTLLALMQGVGVLVLVLIGLMLSVRFGSIGVALASALAATVWVLSTVALLQRGLKLKMGPI